MIDFEPSSARELHLDFDKIFLRCEFIVCMERFKISAISTVLFPSKTRRSISFSLLENRSFIGSKRSEWVFTL